MSLRNNQITLSEIKGKTVSCLTTGYGDNIIIVFDDDTFIHLGISRGYDHGDEEIVEEKFIYGGSTVPDSELIRIGMYTKEELDSIRRWREQVRRERDEDQDREQYERLKAKFDGK